MGLVAIVRQHVVLQLGFVTVAFAAAGAAEGLFLVQLLMCSHVLQEGKLLPTLGAFVWLLARVDDDMLLQVAAESKTLAAHFALVGWNTEGLGTQGAVEYPLGFLILAGVLFLLGGHWGRFAGRIAEGGGSLQPVLAAVRLHVLCKSEGFAALGAAEGLLPRVQVLVLVEEAAVLESLPAGVAEVGAPAVCVPAAVVLHDGVVLENHAALRALVGFESRVASLVEAQGHGVGEGLAALLAGEGALPGMCHHVLGDRHLELEVLAAEGAVVRLFRSTAAAVVPQPAHGGEGPLAFCALEPALLRLRLLLQSQRPLLPGFVFIPVFDEAAAVLESKAALLAGEGCELVLVRVEVAVEVEGLAPVEPLPALLAHQTAPFRFGAP
ncbi:unnamed protein product, partial [Menidia menidia]